MGNIDEILMLNLSKAEMGISLEILKILKDKKCLVAGARFELTTFRL
jgi:hypothetical protein